MSFNVQTLKSATDDTIPSFLREAQNGTTAVISHNTIYEWGLIGKGARIINNDGVNELQVQLHASSGTPIIIPTNSELNINEWFATIIVTPDGTTGNFQITLEIADLKDASK